MTQSRYINFGAPVDAEKIKSITNGIVSASLLEGGLITVPAGSTDSLRIDPLVLSFNDGIVLKEDAYQTVSRNMLGTAISPTPVIGSLPWTITIYMDHFDIDMIGGSSATLKVISGIKTDIDLPNACIIGWFVYPGGAGPGFNSEMVYNAPFRKYRSSGSPAEASWMIAPLQTYQYSAPGMTVTRGFDTSKNKTYTQFPNITGGDLNAIFTLAFPIPAGNLLPRLFEVNYHVVSPSVAPTLSDFYVYDSVGTKLQAGSGLSSFITTFQSVLDTSIYFTRIRIYPELFAFPAGNTMYVQFKMTLPTMSTTRYLWSRVSTCDTPAG